MMEKIGFEEGDELKHPWLNRSIQSAQKKVEQHNFQIRKRTLKYDDVMNKHRQVIYDFRNSIINGDCALKLEPQRDDGAINAALQQVHGGAVSQHVWRDAGLDFKDGQSWRAATHMLGEHVFELRPAATTVCRAIRGRAECRVGRFAHTATLGAL